MQQLVLPECVYNDLRTFISSYSSKNLPHPLLIAQAFCLKYKKHGREYSLSIITDTVEYILNNNH
jgi:hypothetical protein